MALLVCLFIASASLMAQQNEKKASLLYNPAASAETQIKDAVKLAKQTNRHVLLQVGGNWCIWCTRFHNMVAADAGLTALADSNYVVVLLNYSKENKNEKTLARLGYPQRFGFPVFVILDAKGNRIHTQNSAYLEEDKGYSRGKVETFFRQWSPKALDPATYQEKK